MIKAITTIHWGGAGAVLQVREAVATSTAVLVKRVLDRDKCDAVLRAVSESGPTTFLEPFPGENIVSYARNPRTKHTYPPSLLLSGKGGASLAQTRLDLRPCFEPRTALPKSMRKQLLGGFALNEKASMLFVTAAGVRTPLHSDERHGMLLHVSGQKNFVVVPSSESDGDKATLRELLSLRDAVGSQAEVFDEVAPATPALLKVKRFQGALEPGDALFLPQRWLHDIESETPTVSVSLRFGNWDRPN